MKVVRVISSLVQHMFGKHERARALWVLAVAPAVLVLLSILGLLLLLTSSASSVLTWYHQKAMIALSKKDYSTARLCYAALLQRKPDEPSYRFGLGLSLAGLGDGRAAANTIRQLAPADGVGYPQAHRLLADRLIRESNGDPAMLKEAESHLLKILKVQPKDGETHAMLVGIYAKEERWEDVKEHLLLAGSSVDSLSMVAAKMFASRGDMGAAQVWARRAVSYYIAKVREEPKVTEHRIELARAYLLLREFDNAIQTLQKGYNDLKEPSLRQLVGQVFSIWLENSPSLDAVRKLSLLEEGLSWDGQNSKLLTFLRSPAAKEAVDGVLPSTQPVAGAAVRAVASAIANARAGKPDDVRSDLELALTLQPQSMVAISANVACVWAYAKERDSAESVLIADTLYSLRPQEVYAKRARGLTLSLYGDKKESARLLEEILPSMPNDRAIHQALADDYEALGRPDDAAAHRQLATTQPTTAPASTQPK